ncbi:MAG: protease pro-enzyme activation domain-containing protein [Actinomycetes bacterium]
MRRRFEVVLAAFAVCISVLVTPLSAQALVRSFTIDWISPGIAPPAGATLLRGDSNGALLDLRVVLEPNDSGTLAQFVKDVSTPGNPLFRHFLSPAEFAQRFGATPSAIALVRSELRSTGLTVSSISPNNLVLRVTGRAEQVAATFHTKLQRYRDVSGEIATVATSRIGLISPIARYVAGISGLNGFERPHASSAVTNASVSRPSLTGPTACTAANNAAASRGAYLPAEITHAYGLDTAYANGFNGAGHSVAVVEFADYYRNDMTTYLNCFGLSNRIIDVVMNGGAGASTAADGGAEVELDLQQIASLAPGATIYNYMHPNDANGFVDEFSRIASDHLADSVSVSWGLCEADISSAAQQPLLQQLAAQGQSVFVAAGDSGSSSCAYSAAPGDATVSYSPIVDDPANSPWVTGIGGLSVTSISPLVQSVWNGGCGSPCGGGGGFSNVYGRPDWQVGPGVTLNNQRQVPDISVMGDPRTGMLVYFAGGWHGFGGTSIGAPILGAMAAVGAQACGITNLGFLNPRLYQMAINGTGIVDVTTGSNDIYGTGSYSATSGYDVASGLGSPNPATFLPALCGQAHTFSTSKTGTGVAATWTFNYFSSGTALNAGDDTITIHGMVSGGLSTDATNYTINGVHPRSASVTGTDATLVLGAGIAPLAAVVVVATGAINGITPGSNVLEISDSNNSYTSFQATLTTSVVSVVSSTVSSSPGVGTTGATVLVTVRNSDQSTIAGISVSLRTPTGVGVIPTSGSVTDLHGVSTFRIVTGNTGPVNVTAVAGGVSAAAVTTTFISTWRSASTAVPSAMGTIMGVPASSTNCGTVSRTSKGALYSTLSAVSSLLVTSKGVARVPDVASDPDVIDNPAGGCFIVYVGKDAKVRLLAIANARLVTTVLNTAAADKAAVASPGISIANGRIYVANISTTGYLYVSIVNGSQVTRTNISVLNAMPKVTGTGYALAQAVTSTVEGPSIVLRVGREISLFTYNTTFGTWDGVDISGWARWTLGTDTTFIGNPTLAGERRLAVYVRTTKFHLIELLPLTTSNGSWVTDDLTATYAPLTPQSDVVLFGTSARQLAVLVDGKVVVLIENGPPSETWIPVTITLAGVKSLFAYGSGSLGATLGTKLATFSP